MSFPAVIDNTMRKDFVACPTRFYQRHVAQIVPVDAKVVDLFFGECFALGCEIARKRYYWQGFSESSAIQIGIDAAIEKYGDFQPPEGSYKTKARLVGALRYYFEQWPLNDDYVPLERGIECRFKVELPILHPDSGEPLFYAGRYDALMRDSNDRLYVVDEKTTSRLGDNWFLQWDMDSQITGYIWSVQQQMGGRNVMGQVRGISILKNDYGHAEVPIVRSQYMIDAWYAQLLDDIHRMIYCYKANHWDRVFGPPCSDWNRACDYKKLCVSPNPERLMDQYETVVWNPLAKE